MRTTWSALYQSFHRSLNRGSSETAFQELRHRHPDLRQFASIAALLQYLQHVDGEPTGRYLIIRQVVLAAQTDADLGLVTVMLVIVALWPGLSSVRYRLRRDFPDEATDLGSEVLARFSELVACIDLGKVRSVSGTLVRNVERDIRRELIRARQRAQRSLDVTNPVVEAEVDRASGSRQPNAVLDDLLVCLSPEHIALLTRVLVLGETQEEAGRAFGFSPSAARKRFQRCIRQLREHHLTGCPIPGIRLAFPKSEDRKGPRKGV